MPKFFVKTNQINNDEIKITGEDVKHIAQVLRAKIGEKLTICNVDNNLNYITTISKISQDYILCHIEDCNKSFIESNIEVTIFQGLPKADKMEYIIQKNVELGVKQITPIIMSRCVAKLDEKTANKKIGRWQKIAESAAKQSGREYIPTIEMPINISKVCEKIKDFDLVLLAYESEENITLKQELKKLENNNGLKIGVIIGPEGGIDYKEVEMLTKAGSKVITLGKRILRTETASVAIMSNIIYEYEM